MPGQDHCDTKLVGAVGDGDDAGWKLQTHRLSEGTNRGSTAWDSRGARSGRTGERMAIIVPEPVISSAC